MRPTKSQLKLYIVIEHGLSGLSLVAVLDGSNLLTALSRIGGVGCGWPQWRASAEVVGMKVGMASPAKECLSTCPTPVTTTCRST